MNIRKVIGIVSSVAVVLLSAPLALAEEGVGVTQSLTAESQVDGTAEVKTEATVDVTVSNQGTATRVRDALQVKTQAAREEAKARMEASREEAKAKMEAAREAAKARMETSREAAKVKIEASREEAKARMEVKREEAKQRLADIRDKQKQQRAERIAEQFDKLNKRWTDHFINQLDHYNAVLLKIRARADIAAGAGKDTSATLSAIASAEASINTARTAVVAQAAKTYVLDTSTITTTTSTTTESNQDELVSSLRVAFQTLHTTLFGDLKALRDGVMKDARAAVKNALETLRQVPRVDDDSTDDSSDDSNQ